MEFEKINAYLEEHKDEMIADIMELMRIDSAKTEALPGMPYGEGPARALEAGTALAERFGFHVTNYGNRAIAADFSEGEKGLDILAHLDVVPAGNGWSVTAPFEPLLRDGLLYGRGSSDDKGPAVAALYAMRCVKELGFPLTKNVRLILGSDEECGSSDLEYYYSVEKEAPMSFSPDADFPVVNVEKGRFTPVIRACWKPEGGLPRVCSAYAGDKINVVPDRASAVLEGISCHEVEKAAMACAEETKAVYEVSESEGKTHVLVKGLSAHASTPYNGNNALTALIVLLNRLPLAPGAAKDALAALGELFPHGSSDGEPLGIAMRDEISEDLTISLNMLRIGEEGMEASCDSRVPACATAENTAGVMGERLASRGLTLASADLLEAHCVPDEAPLIKILLNAYERVSGKKGFCQKLGGLTYVHELKNGVAFGCGELDVDNHMHGANEFVKVQLLCDSAKMFALAILDICK